MAYIPESHKKYNLLPRCAEHGGEVFSYPSIENEISAMLPEGEHVIPYGYDSYAEFDEQLDCYIEQYGKENGVFNELGHMLEKYKNVIKKMNVKENWSVLRYIGETTSNLFGLTHGNYYYWPCSVEYPEYEGIIDDEEFTSYICYATESPVISEDDVVIKGGNFAPYAGNNLWEITEDPTGMAARVLSGEIDPIGIKPRKTVDSTNGGSAHAI